MKKATILLFMIFIVSNSYGQNRDSKSVDVFCGYTFSSGISFGVNTRNFIDSVFGIYFMTHYFNTAFEEGKSGDDHFNSAFGWTTYYDTTYTDIKPWGMTFGLTYNFSKLFHSPNCGLSILLGVGWTTKQTEQAVSSTRIYNNQYLDPTTETYTSVEKNTSASFEAILNYDVVSEGRTSFSLLAGYNSGCGAVAGGALGFRF